jgi:hypothetical protein
MHPGGHDAYRGALDDWLRERDRDPAGLTTEAAVIRALLAVADETLTELASERGYAQLDTWYATNPDEAAEERAEREAMRSRRTRREGRRHRAEGDDTTTAA